MWSQQTIGNQNLPENLISKLTHEMLLGLEYLHYHSVKHINLNPSNVFMTAEGHCMLSDFGSVKQICLEAFSKPKFSLNAPFWTAPECLRKDTRDKKLRFSDIWSLGCIVFQMASGEPPWSQEDPLSILIKIAEAKHGPRYPSFLSDELRDFLDSCFQPDPLQRANVHELIRHPFVQ